jgi:putative Mg2+ transporter-C (MgtC) family protein
MRDFLHMISPRIDMATIVSQTVVRLILAAILGGVIGLEREAAHKPAGLRTNMFICFGSAMFTILSNALAGEYVGDHTRIAAQIIPGIGFIGAGSILHSRGSVTGLTTAATLFVVASIGMAAGGGLYLPAIFSTIIIFIALHFLGIIETRYNLKPMMRAYAVTGERADEIIAEVNRILDEEKRIMQTVEVARANGDFIVHFTVEGTHKDHTTLFERLRQSSRLKRVEDLGTQARE